MKRIGLLFWFIFISLPVNDSVFAQAETGSPERKACPFSIIGLWRSDVTTQSNPVFFSFSPNGWVTLLGYSADRLPQDFEMLTEVTYQLDNPAKPKQIEFRTNRGNDAFPPGITLLKIIGYGEDSFTTLDELSEQKTLWRREQTNRFFLSFIARRSKLTADGIAYVLWTSLDGRGVKSEALGVQPIKDESGKTQVVFGKIPPAIFERISEENEKDRKDKNEETVMMRFELTRSEFAATLQLFEIWEKQIKAEKLPFGTPYQNHLEFQNRALELLIPCGAKSKLIRLTQRENDEITTRQQQPQAAFEMIRRLKLKNPELHVDDAMFPWGWRPMLQFPSQESNSSGPLLASRQPESVSSSPDLQKFNSADAGVGVVKKLLTIRRNEYDW